MPPTKREQRKARRALLRQLITAGFAVVIAALNSSGKAADRSATASGRPA